MTEPTENSKRVERMSQPLHAIMDGIGNVYFNPPNKLQYPCIVYELARRTSKHADDIRYLSHDQYTVTVITTEPDSAIPEMVENAFKYIDHDKRFVNDRLYHDIYTVFV